MILLRRLGLTGSIGACLLAAVLALAIFGPLLAPHGEVDLLGAPFGPSDSGHLLGTDVLGRDVLSRVLHGGQTTVVLAGLAVVGAYALGLPLGTAAAYSRSVRGRAILAVLDTVLVIPGLVLLMVFVTALGPGLSTVLGVVVLFQAASVGRVIYAAAQPVAVLDFVDAARLRGQSALSIILRELIPNVRATITAELGLRFTASVIVIAGANFLGFGVQRPAADWGAMAAENRPGMTSQPWSVLAPVALVALLSVSVSLLVDAGVERAEARR